MAKPGPISAKPLSVLLSDVFSDAYAKQGFAARELVTRWARSQSRKWRKPCPRSRTRNCARHWRGLVPRSSEIEPLAKPGRGHSPLQRWSFQASERLVRWELWAWKRRSGADR